MFKPKKIWIIEDDKDCQFIYEVVLGIRYHIEILNNLSAFEAKLASNERPHLVIADLRLPDGNFLQLIDNGVIRSSLGEHIPLIVVSDLDDIDALRYSFIAGALEYVTKPFSKNELIVRVERILEITNANGSHPEDLRTIKIDPTSLTVTVGSVRSLPLTSKEFQIIAIMAGAPDMTVNRSELQRRVWGDVIVSQNTLDVHMFNLRKKIKPLELDISHTPPHTYRILRDRVDH